MTTKNPKPDDRYPVPALDKGLDLLELLAAHPHGLGLTELAAAVSRKVSEIFRTVNCLKRRGYIAVDPRTDRIVLSMRLFELAHTHPPTERLLSVALPEMQALARHTGQSCHLAIHSAGEMLVIAQVDSPRRMGFAVHVGARVGLTSSASGRVFLAFQEDTERARFLTMQPLDAARTEDFNAAPIRKKGFVSMPSDFIRGVTNMSFPVIDFSGHASGALTIPFLQWDNDNTHPTITATRTRLGEAAQAVAKGIGALNS